MPETDTQPGQTHACMESRMCRCACEASATSSERSPRGSLSSEVSAELWGLPHTACTCLHIPAGMCTCLRQTQPGQSHTHYRLHTLPEHASERHSQDKVTYTACTCLHTPETDCTHCLHTPETDCTHCLHTPETDCTHCLHTPETDCTHCLHTPETDCTHCPHMPETDCTHCLHTPETDCTHCLHTPETDCTHCPHMPETYTARTECTIQMLASTIEGLTAFSYW
ncbi:hypothetical protein DUNSADRAFT_9419 [Dunaliella salina]|uniref:Uncharacterized protein n=1 Tax=Dunaliella salina TaxID=3046 RepID=A0ABQ7GHI6_DUNSA|nr:hypothetical protein DUNSADRAFT_9419 [Dunaliella salina]|eukprot:KAF5834069.1 hypothetical protein DUNSADRAFT_9419 [Dunaliella salina]